MAYLDRNEKPLPVRMRPASLDEYVGQEHILGPGKLLRKAIKADQIGSLILYGPPGSGKTTLAYVISQVTRAYYIQVSATDTGVAELKKIISEAKDRLKFQNQKTILFIDEIQRLNKGQQDVLLPAMENGDICLIAAYRKPYFEVNAALLPIQDFSAEASHQRTFGKDHRTGRQIAARLIIPRLPLRP